MGEKSDGCSDAGWESRGSPPAGVGLFEDRRLQNRPGARERTPASQVYRETTWAQSDLTGFSVETLGGSIGKIDEASNEVGASSLVVDRGPWIFGQKVMLTAGVVRDVDLDTQTIFVNRDKDEIKNAPEFNQYLYRNDTYRRDLGGYYGRGGPGYRGDL